MITKAKLCRTVQCTRTSRTSNDEPVFDTSLMRYFEYRHSPLRNSQQICKQHWLVIQSSTHTHNHQ